MRIIWLVLALLPRWTLNVILWVSYILWSIWDSLARWLASVQVRQLACCLGCFCAIPLYLLAFALTIVSAPLFVLYMLIGRIDIAVADNEVEARLRTASATFFWPSLVLFWLMPKFYGVDIEVPPETTLGVSRTYVLRDLQSGEAVAIELGPETVETGQ